MKVFVLIGLLHDEGEHILGVYASEEEAFAAHENYLENDEQDNVYFDNYVIEARELNASAKKSFEVMPIVVNPFVAQ